MSDKYCCNCKYGDCINYGKKGKFHCWLCCEISIYIRIFKLQINIQNLGWKNGYVWNNYDHTTPKLKKEQDDE